VSLLFAFSVSSLADTSVSDSAYLGVEIRADIYGNEIYLKSYCRVQTTCVLTSGRIHASFFLSESAYQINIFDSAGGGTLFGGGGASTLFLLEDQKTLDVELFAHTAKGRNSVGLLRMRRIDD
jgi:uncharacterized membrane protein YgcG